jgi:hypothetical protein
MNKIRIVAQAANLVREATLNDTRTAAKFIDALPLEGKAHVWGKEVYFETDIRAEEENAHERVPPGTLAYWPPGHAFCIFLGQTPYSPVNVIGDVEGDPEAFETVRSGDTLRVELAD